MIGSEADPQTVFLAHGGVEDPFFRHRDGVNPDPALRALVEGYGTGNLEDGKVRSEEVDGKEEKPETNCDLSFHGTIK